MGAPTTRRNVLKGAVGAVVAAAAGRLGWAGELAPAILDSHVHAWDLKQFRLPWLDRDPLLRRDFSIADYRKAVEGLNIRRAVYIEVNVDAGQRGAEATYAAGLCDRGEALFAGAVIAADPSDPQLGAFLDRFAADKSIKGVRFFYPANGSRDPAFLKGMRSLGYRKLSFELQLGPDRLADAAKTAAACPETRFILNHCGGAEPRNFRKGADSQTADVWRQGIAALARCPNVRCKISGVADNALPGDATAEDVAPIVRHCLDQFGPDRVMFGGNWPVCLKATTLRDWVLALDQLVARRSESERRRLYRDNAIDAYRLT